MPMHSPGICSSAISRPTAIARSNPEPALRWLDGARFTVSRFCGHLNPLDTGEVGCYFLRMRHSKRVEDEARHPIDPQVIQRELLRRYQNLPERERRVMVEVQAIAREHVPVGVSLVDELSEDRRRDRA